MIGIRSITYQLPETFTENHLAKIGEVSRVWDSSYNFIRTQRVSLCPYKEAVDLKELIVLSRLCDETRIRWFNVPLDPFQSKNQGGLMKFGHSILSEYSRSFVNVLAVKNDTMHSAILGECANLIRKISNLSNDGKDNFRLGLSVNVKPDGPFFPFTYSSGVFGFSIALELTQEINGILDDVRNLDMSKQRETIINRITPQIEEINNIAEKISNETGLLFKGFDFSLAPIIDPNGSVISILNSFGVYNFGKTGSLFVTGFLTNILKHFAKKFKSVGFSGVMYSLLEDIELCSINNERGISLEQLIKLSTMCGCGVDMVPVYGKLTNDEFLSIFLEVAGISCKLKKPLGIRLLPIPRCKRNEKAFTLFQDDPDFITNTRVVPLDLNIISPIGEVFDFLQN